MKKKIKILIAIILLLVLIPVISIIINSFIMVSMFTGSSSQTDTAVSTTPNYRDAYNGTGVPETIPQEVLDEYLEDFAPADDEYDFMYANDYEEWSLANLVRGRDQSTYEKILGYSDVTLEEIRQAADANPNISQKYKDFIYQYACDLRRLYPDVNLAVLHNNLKTLVIDEMTQADIDKETMSTDSAACYLRYENRICVVENLDLSRESDDFIVLTHELCHAARSVQSGRDDVNVTDIDIGFYDNYKMGTYAEEGIVTNIAYEIQGFGNKATFYPVLASYYRIICSCIDYSGADFFNHGVNYLIDKMDEFMGDEQYAYQIVAMIDAQMSLRYTPYQGVDFHDFQPMYEYLAKMYFKKNIHANMSHTQAQKVFDAFYEEITFNFENMNRKFTFNESTFLPTFESYVSELGIQQ